VVCGPIAGGRGAPFGSPLRDLDAYGYVQHEWFVSGDASTFDLGSRRRPSRDGHWGARPARTLPYRTRVLVRRPTDPRRFNGTLVAIWTNVSLGWDFFDGESPELLEGGFAVAVVTAQRAGIEGLPDKVPEGLRSWDLVRYRDLSIPTDDLSYDIFGQVIAALRAGRSDDESDMMGGLEVEHVIATGSSQGAVRVATYLNSVHPLAPVVDGFLIELYVGAGSPLAADDPHVEWPAIAAGPFPQGWHLLRTDTGARIMVLNTESDALCYLPVRQDDSEVFRLWEVAGTAHSGKWGVDLAFARYAQEFGQPFPGGLRNPYPNNVDFVAVRDAAFHHMHRWVNGQAAPPAQPRLVIGGDPPEIRRDRFGNALGGVRLPALDVPVAEHSGYRSSPGRPTLTGRSRPLPAEQLAELYPDEKTYAARFARAAHEAVRRGVLLPRDAARQCSQAALPGG
jgi:hypothetical protein